MTATRTTPLRHAVKTRFLPALMLVAIGGCGAEDSTPEPAGSAVTTSTAQQIAQLSADNYDDNLSGLITGVTLQRWIGNWQRERPAGITGNLIILQATEGPAGFRFIRPDNVDVLTFVESRWTQVRANGVTEIAGGVLTGAAVDLLLDEYGIDVSRDLIVCAQGAATTESYFAQALCWHTLRYWGVPATHLALLSGSNAHLGTTWSTGHFSQADFIPALPGQPSPTNQIRGRDVVSIKALRRDNTALQATLAELISALPAQDANSPADGVFLWDARTLEEYSAGEATEAALPAVVPLADRFTSIRNGASRQGHPRGALNLDWRHLLDSSSGVFRSKAELAALVSGAVAGTNRGFVSAQYQFVGPGNGYQLGDVIYVWSETASRAAVAQVVATAVLGLPSRLYAGGTLEWNSLTGGAVDRDGTPLLPVSSPWRTDTLSSTGLANIAALIEPRNAWSDPANPKVAVATATQPRIIAPFAAGTAAAVALDRTYVGSPDTGLPPGGGVRPPLLPPNPCGG